MYRNDRPIAILLAVYNGEKYLAEQIDSLLAQTSKQWTLYIRNDGSADATPQIIQRYCRQHPGRIVAVEDGDGNLGCRGNFFRLLEVVESDYYMFCDGDDVWLPDKVGASFEEIRRRERQYPGIPILVHADRKVCDERLNVRVPSDWRSVGRNPDLFSTRRYIPAIWIAGGATSIFNRRARACSLPLPADPPMHDTWLSMQVVAHGRIFALHRPLLLYRQHGGNFSGTKAERYRFGLKKISRLGQVLDEHYKRVRYWEKLGFYSGRRMSRGRIFFDYLVMKVGFLLKMQYSKWTYGRSKSADER